MEEKIEVGEYVRFRNGEIDRIKDIGNTYGERKLIAFENRTSYLSDLGLKKQLAKPLSFDLIDLIEVGDYVNGKEVIEVRRHNSKIYLMTGYCPQEYIKNKIKSIVTKKQFESVKYEVI